MARHSATKKTSFSHIRFPSFSPQQTNKMSTDKTRCLSPEAFKNFIHSISLISKAPASARNYPMKGGTAEFRPKRFSFAINRKRWFSTSTSDPNARHSPGDSSRRTSTTEISSNFPSGLSASYGGL
jgi:hypothetical protein